MHTLEKLNPAQCQQHNKLNFLILSAKVFGWYCTYIWVSVALGWALIRDYNVSDDNNSDKHNGIWQQEISVSCETFLNYSQVNFVATTIMSTNKYDHEGISKLSKLNSLVYLRTSDQQQKETGLHSCKRVISYNWVVRINAEIQMCEFSETVAF